MSKFKFDKKASNFRSSKSKLLETLANNAINQFKVKNFDAQGFVDTTVQKWAPRKNDKDPSRKILVKTGRLRQSITVVGRTNDSVKVGTAVTYAQYINNGTEHMKARKFIGKSDVLDRKNKSIINKYVKGVL